ncbi:hypothetical protein QIH01_18360 [Brevibacillus brevis]|uniref:hypothetical protein n=1 Tax=Brevibacillus brevis TaxID=1393 RepID=UPI0007D8BD97|nr:hypothetical protein [Brevibacillus brevis]WGV57453.1 hypothetical protein QIH01_18360 [Brevibacillus brevis]
MNDPRSNRPDYWLIIILEAARKMLRGQMSQKEFMDQYVLENSWPENPLLMKHRNEYNQMLKFLSLQNRRLFCFKASHLTYQKIRKMYGYGHNRTQKYLNMEQDKTDSRFTAELAIIHRVPNLWLEHHEVEDEWSTYHFHSIGKSPQSIEELLQLIATIKESDEWIQGFILRARYSGFIFLRLEAQRGNILIEVNNKNARPTDIYWLLSNLKQYNYEVGEIATVIPSQDNLAIVCKKNHIPFCLPIGFNSIKSCTKLGT